MISKDVKVHAELTEFSRWVDLYLWRGSEDGSNDTLFVLDVREVPTELHRPASEASLKLPHPVAQRLMNELWGLGLRPAQQDSSANHVTALTRHLEDMRLLLLGDQQALRTAEEELRKRVVTFPPAKIYP